MGSYVVTNPSRQQQLKIRDSLVGGCTLVATICPTLPDEVGASNTRALPRMKTAFFIPQRQ